MSTNSKQSKTIVSTNSSHPMTMSSNSSQPRTIVIAIDDSKHSEYAFDFYVENIHREGDRIILVHVPEHGNLLTTSSLLTDPSIVADLLRDTEEKTRYLVEKYSVKMQEIHLSGHVKQKCGKPGEGIIEAAREEEAAMLILGTRGMGLIRRTILGSVSDYCLHHSDIPVVVCRHRTNKISHIDKQADSSAMSTT